MKMAIHRPSELQSQRTIVEAARLHGWLVHAERTAQTQSGRWSTPVQGDVGFPDLVLTRDGLCLAIECKRKPNKVTLPQTLWLDELGKVPGITAMVVWVPDQVDAFIASLARPKVARIQVAAGGGRGGLRPTGLGGGGGAHMKWNLP